MNHKEYFYHPTLCPIPWSGVYIEPDGRVLTCAVGRSTLGNIKTKPIEDILTKGVNEQIRIKQINRDPPDNCGYCYKIDALAHDLTASQSNRSWYKKMCADSVTSNRYQSSDNFHLEILDLRWRNTCNLACSYCSANLSSRWAQEIGVWPDLPTDQQIEDTKTWIYQHLPTIRHVYLAGGEPLLIKDNLDILQRLKEVNPEVDLRVNTNLINIDTPVFRKLQEFANVKWTVSVENTDEKFHYTRYPGDWKIFSRNLNILMSSTENVNINMTWNLIGAQDIFDCMRYFLEKGYHQNMFIVNMLDDPDYLDVRNLTDTFLDNIRGQIEQMRTNSDPRYWLYKSLNSMYNFLSRPMSMRQSNRALEYFKVLDQRRHLSFPTVFPDVYQDLLSQVS